MVLQELGADMLGLSRISTPTHHRTGAAPVGDLTPIPAT
jgi:hypothetical protein